MVAENVSKTCFGNYFTTTLIVDQFETQLWIDWKLLFWPDFDYFLLRVLGIFYGQINLEIAE